MTRPKILYAGDSWEGGPANYLLAILRHMDADFQHVPAAVRMSEDIIARPFDLFILSDYGAELLSPACQEIMIRRIEAGAGFLMIGGWASFSGPFGGWHGTPVESILPVRCLDQDDRLNTSSGSLIEVQQAHPALGRFDFEPSPVLCGFNRILPREHAQTVLAARQIVQKKDKLSLASEKHPLLVLDGRPGKRIAALATDIAPHWCGGFVDWGEERKKLPVNPKIEVEVGHLYLEFLAHLFAWLSGKA